MGLTDCGAFIDKGEHMPYLICLFLITLIIYFIKSLQFRRTIYYEQTQNSYLSVLLDKGKKGEYLTYKYLKPLKGYKRYLFNIYLPKDNEETTEIDVIMLHEAGVFVFESKNYSGWIFGTETQRNWTQTLPTGKGRTQKNHFLNPIIQNKGHIKWLKAYLKQDIQIYSCIVFSDRCTLKDIRLTSGEHMVINRYDVLKTIRRIAKKQEYHLGEAEIDRLYDFLYPLTQTDIAVKKMHIESINNKKQTKK